MADNKVAVVVEEDPPASVGLVVEEEPAAGGYAIVEEEPEVRPPKLGPDGLPITKAPPIFEGVGTSLAKGLTADLPQSFTAIPRLTARLGAGIVGAIAGETAEEAALKVAQMMPQHRAAILLDQYVFRPLGEYWQKGTLEDLQKQVEGRGVLDMWKDGQLLGYGLRGFAANVPQLALSAGAGLLAKGSKLVALGLPMAMEAGESVMGIEEQERQTGETIDNLRFGGVALAKGIAGGSLEALGAGAVLGKFSKAFPVFQEFEGPVGWMAEQLIEGGTEGAQTFIGNVAEDIAMRPPTSTTDYLTRWQDPAFRRQMMEDVPESAFLGWFSGMAVGTLTYGSPDGKKAPAAGPALPATAAEARSVGDRERRRLIPGGLDETLPVADAAVVKAHLRQQLKDLSDEEFDAVIEIKERQVDAHSNATGLDRSHIWGRMLTEDPLGTPNVRTLYQGAERGQLVVTHNMPEEAIPLFRQLKGAVPGLSIAVTRADQPLTETPSPITIIMDPQAIAPNGDEVVARGGDWSSEMFPVDRVARDTDGLFRDKETGAVLTPELLAGMYVRKEQVDPDAAADLRLGSLGEIRDTARLLFREVATGKESQEVVETRAGLEAALGSVVDPSVAAELADALEAEVYARTGQRRATLRVGNEAVRRALWERGVRLADDKRRAIAVALTDYTQARQDNPRRLIEVKHRPPMDPRRYVAIAVDEDLVSPEAMRLLRLLGQELDVPVFSGTVQVRPDMKPGEPTDFRATVMSQFAQVFLQRSGNKIKGAATVLPDGRYYIEALQGHDVSTALHELAHGWRQELYFMEQHALPHHRKKIQEGLKALEDWAGVKNGRWNRTNEEKFAKAAEEYLRSGKAPIASLKRIFEMFKQWLSAIYPPARARFLPTFSPEVREFFDTYILDVQKAGEFPGAPPKIDRKAQREEDKLAANIALTIRNLEPKRALFVEQLRQLERLMASAKQNAFAKGAADWAESTILSSEERRAEVLDQLGSWERDARRNLTLLLDLSDIVAVDSSMTADDVYAKLVGGQLKFDAFAKRVRTYMAKSEDGFARLAEAKKLFLSLSGYFKLVGKLTEELKQLDEKTNRAEYTKKLAQVYLAGRKLTFQRGLQLVRELMGTAVDDVVQEGKNVEAMTERFFAEPNLLRRYIASAKLGIDKVSTEINEATIRYKVVTRTIAARGMPPETWGLESGDLSGKDAVALAEIQKQVAADIAAARLEIEATDPTALATEGVITDVSSILNELSAQLIRGTETGPSETPSSLSPHIPALVAPSLIDETALLFEGQEDMVVEEAKKAQETPVGVVKKYWRDVIAAVRDATWGQFYTGQTLNPFGKPLQFFNPERFDPDSMVNRLSRKGKLPARQTPYTPEQGRGVQKIFADVEGMINYFENVASPRTREAFYAVLPRLEERQLVTLARDFSGFEMGKVRERFVRQLAEAEADYARAIDAYNNATDPVAKAAAEATKNAAEKVVRKWNWRIRRLNDHRNISRLEMSPRIAHVLKSIGATYDALWLAATQNHLIGSQSFLEDFVNRIYRKKDREEAMKFFKEAMPLDKKNPHSFQRAFDTLIEAHAFGLVPATLDVAELVDAYGRSMIMSISKRQLLMRLMELAPQAFSWRRPRLGGNKNRDSVDEKDRPKELEFLSLDKYVSHTLQAKHAPDPEATLHCERHLWNLFHNLYELSAFDTNPILNYVKKINNWLKRIQLAIDLYHFFQVSRMAMALGNIGEAGNKIGKANVPFIPFQMTMAYLGMTDPRHPKHPMVRELMEAGLQLSSGDWARRKLHEYLEATIGKATIPSFYHLMGHKLEAFSRVLWEEYVPGLKVMVAMQQLERLQRMPKHKDANRAELVASATKFTNDLFGGMSWATHGRSKTQSDLLRILFLAPDWLETRFRTVMGLFRKGPEKDLWFEFWFGQAGTRARQHAEAMLKNDPSLVEGGPVRWATGYVWQGMIFTAAMNALVWGAMGLGAGGGDDDEEKPYGAEWFTSIVFPTQDRRGAPLKISLFSTVDYLTAFLGDLTSITPMLRFWSGRQGPFLRSAKQVVVGTDFAGRSMRAGMTDVEANINILFESCLPWFNNILYGSASEPFFQDKWEFYMVRNVSRTLGGHTTSSYDVALMEEYDFYVAQARGWNTTTKKLIERSYAIPGFKYPVNAWARLHAWNHNRRVRGLLKKMNKSDLARRQLGSRVMADKGSLMMWSP